MLITSVLVLGWALCCRVISMTWGYVFGQRSGGMDLVPELRCVAWGHGEGIIRKGEDGERACEACTSPVPFCLCWDKPKQEEWGPLQERDSRHCSWVMRGLISGLHTSHWDAVLRLWLLMRRLGSGQSQQWDLLDAFSFTRALAWITRVTYVLPVPQAPVDTSSPSC